MQQGQNHRKVKILSPHLMRSFIFNHRQRSSSELLCSLFNALYFHYYSFNMFIRPTVLFEIPPLQDPIAELPASEFYELCRFWPGQFEEIANNLLLIPVQIVCSTTRCSFSKHVAVFFMLRRWNKADNWEDVSRIMR
jgi:hypothetical protein